MRDFRLFKHPSGAFEVVPIGWSFWALLLHIFWAVGSGLFVRSALYLIPTIGLLAVGVYLHEVQQSKAFGELFFVAALLVGNGFVIYFSFVAHEWRADVLRGQGYEQIASIRGRTGRDALSRWARSDQADEVLGNTNIRNFE